MKPEKRRSVPTSRVFVSSRLVRSTVATSARTQEMRTWRLRASAVIHNVHLPYSCKRAGSNVRSRAFDWSIAKYGLEVYKVM